MVQMRPKIQEVVPEVWARSPITSKKSTSPKSSHLLLWLWGAWAIAKVKSKGRFSARACIHWTSPSGKLRALWVAARLIRSRSPVHSHPAQASLGKLICRGLLAPSKRSASKRYLLSWSLGSKRQMRPSKACMTAATTYRIRHAW